MVRMRCAAPVGREVGGGGGCFNGEAAYDGGADGTRGGGRAEDDTSARCARRCASYSRLWLPPLHRCGEARAQVRPLTAKVNKTALRSAAPRAHVARLHTWRQR